MSLVTLQSGDCILVLWETFKHGEFGTKAGCRVRCDDRGGVVYVIPFEQDLEDLDG